MKAKRIIAALTLIVLVIIAAVAFLHTKVSITQGVDGHYRKIKMPLYAKAIEFLARHYEYVRISREITAACHTEEEKALAVLKWTDENIFPGVPEDLPVVDDHVLNIIIRGYGTNDQLQDVFTTLCAYAGMPAFWKKVYDDTGKVWWPLSFVRINGRWTVFDAYYGIYLRTKDGNVASVEEIMNDRSLVSGEDIEDIMAGGIAYKEFYYNIKPVDVEHTMRAEKQMPAKRFLYEIEKLFHGIKKP